jgi:hypothetical protein
MDNLEYNRIVTKLREIGRDAESRARLGARSRVLSQQGISTKVALVWMGLPSQRSVQAVTPEMIIEATDTPFYAAPLNRRVICELFKTFEDLGLGKYHPTSDAGHPEGTIELFANCNDIGNAALGFAHLLDVVRPQDKPLTGTARDQHIADRLMRMAELRPVNEGRILAWLAAASHMEDGTSVQSVSDANQVAERVVSDLFRILETIGVGRYVEASTDAPARMEWYASSKEVGRAACGMDHDLRVVGPGFCGDDHVVARLRRLYQSRGGNERLILTALSVRDHMKDGTSIEEFSNAYDVPQHLASGLFEDLEALGVGQYVRSENGKPAYMEWHASSQEVGKAACGKPHHLMITGPGFDLDRANALRRHASMVANELGVSEDQVVISIRP